MERLTGKVAVITGGNSGIGLATAKRFVSEGAYVFISGRRQDELDKAVAILGSGVTGVQGDISNLDDLDRLFATVQAEKGHVDVLFANAGIGGRNPLGAISEEQFDKIFDVNVKGTLFTMQKALPLMRAGGSIILTGSTTGSMGTPAFSVYSATKAAIRNFARSWALDLKRVQVSGSMCSRRGLQRHQVFSMDWRRRECKKLFLPVLPVRHHLNVWATRTKRLPWPCSSPPMTAAL
jgi:NAD(P)-dependent dehydrogenase (short-subunit alcohol dehydrogenase family)